MNANSDPARCPHFQTCEASLCPISGRGIWYPGEAVCIRTDAPPWVKRQRKIARARKLPTDGSCLLPRFDLGFFTPPMLETITRGGQFHGANPLLPDAEKDWLAGRREREGVSPLRDGHAPIDETARSPQGGIQHHEAVKTGGEMRLTGL